MDGAQKKWDMKKNQTAPKSLIENKKATTTNVSMEKVIKILSHFFPSLD